ncbi:MAG: hypothetical protein ACYDAL_04315 [Candidatus Dormibacteraceae bacterium]
MNKTRSLIFGSVVVASMIFGGIVSATVFAKTQSAFNVSAAVTAASPTPSPKSNEATTHESGESAAHETAENNGTLHPGGSGGPGGGLSNETSAHEAAETAAHEAAEKT